MKNDTIQALLAKREAGTITDDELTSLNALTRRDEVVAGAEKRAVGIRRTRRRVMTTAVALVGVAVAGVALLVPRQEPQLMAKQPAVVEQPVREDVGPSPVEAVPLQTASINMEKAATIRSSVKKAHKEEPVLRRKAEPVVTCNNQCDADSVINDIWKFLTA